MIKKQAKKKENKKHQKVSHTLGRILNVKSILVLTALAHFIFIASTSAATTSTSISTPSFNDDPGNLSNDPNVFHHAWATIKGSFDQTGLEILGAGTLVTFVALSQDIAVHDAMANNQRMNMTLTDLGTNLGAGYLQGGIVLGQLIFDRQNGIPSLEGILLSTVVALGLKYSVRRERPDSAGETDSFPSGHTQISFASAMTLQESYGWGVGVPMFALGTFIGLSRISNDRHWFSDVTAGATVGILFGRGGFRHHRNKNRSNADEANEIKLSPITSFGNEPATGAMLSMRF